MKSRDYYTDFAKDLPSNTVILTAGCAKYRCNKLGLGDNGGIPRVLDAGQCYDSYSLAVIALKLGPTLPAFLSPNVANVLVNTFGINGIGTVEEDWNRNIVIWFNF